MKDKPSLIFKAAPVQRSLLQRSFLMLYLTFSKIFKKMHCLAAQVLCCAMYCAAFWDWFSSLVRSFQELGTSQFWSKWSRSEYYKPNPSDLFWSANKVHGKDFSKSKTLYFWLFLSQFDRFTNLYVENDLSGPKQNSKQKEKQNKSGQEE